MAFEYLEDFGRKRPAYDVNLARMRNDAHSDKITLFVEGDDDRTFFRSHLKDRLKWKIEFGPKKKGVLARYRKYLENPTVHFAVFCVDLDFDFAVELLKKSRDDSSRIIDDEQLLYQLFDVDACAGFNDLETFLFLSDSYSGMMVEYYDDDEIIESIRDGIKTVGVTMGALRVANILVREEWGLPDDASMLCQREGGNHGGLKFDVDFMDSFGLLDLKHLTSASLELIGENLMLAFSENEYSEHLPAVIKRAAEVLDFIEGHPKYFANFLRGHDLMDLLARRMAFDRNRKGSSFKSRKKLPDGGKVDFEKFREELESDLRKAAGDSMERIKEFPLGRLLK
ncbi:Protein of unknown function [Fibrobacter sp. UWH9]|uniref:DUF4435 domain-containing protein n=1 Tax=unclassified Fibrobacter TaxID=2634177 RepID=UPI00091D6F62|nr:MULTISPECIES: DUF4435 domain-containing protein [Fibrobacter]MCL4103486.1 hypothetical protein [Fibrobacter succinogenes]OWV05794.1 hypothetical protein B7992_15330 [Fibrobacter sp. UWH1]SHH90859.1 Protein of unknown function [Fibrobacter sp. UWH9]